MNHIENSIHNHDVQSDNNNNNINNNNHNIIISYNATDTISTDDIQSELHDAIYNDNFFSDFNNELEQDNLLAQHMNYLDNYTLKSLHYIAGYYKLKKNKTKKEQLVQNIIEFENNPENSEIVYARKRMWYFIHELKDDDYFSKFVIL